MRVKADVSEAQEFAPLVNGTYSVEGMKAIPGKAQETGNPVLKLEMQILDGPDLDEKGTSPAGRPLFKTIPMSGKGAGILLNALDSFEVPYDKQGDSIEFDPEDFIGQEAEVRVRQREYQGEIQPDVKRFRKTGSSKEEPEE